MRYRCGLSRNSEFLASSSRRNLERADGVAGVVQLIRQRNLPTLMTMKRYGANAPVGALVMFECLNSERNIDTVK